jgi:alpha-amylase
MMEWALPSDTLNEYKDFLHIMKGEEQLADGREFVRGGFWRSFFSKYDESNHIHKKMLRVSRKLAAAPEDFRRSPQYATAMDHLWRGQCNCAYWHGVFGGLYLANLRNALYENLIAAEAIADEAAHGKSGWTQITAEDFDADGGQELIVESAAQTIMLQPHRGGMMIEHDARALRFDPLDTLMRRREAYHLQLEGSTRQGEQQFRVKDLRVTSALTEDWYRRGSLIDHFLSGDATPEMFREAVYPETGDFVNAPYDCEWKKTKSGAEVTLSRDGAVMTDAGQHAVTIRKTLVCSLDSAAVKIRYEITNRSKQPLRTQFGVEFNVNLLAGDAIDRVHEIDGFRLGALNKMNSTGEIPDAKTFRVVDGWKKLKVEWKLSETSTHWRCPIETVSNSEGGIEKIYQSTVVMPVWDLKLKPGKSWKVDIDYAVVSTP